MRETICQLLTTDSKARILFLAKSCVQADAFTSSLLAILPADKHGVVMRMNAFGRKVANIPSAVLKACTVKGGRIFVPGSVLVLSMRIIITTPTGAGYLESVGVTKDCFSHTFVDDVTDTSLLLALSLCSRSLVLGQCCATLRLGL